MFNYEIRYEYTPFSPRPRVKETLLTSLVVPRPVTAAFAAD